MLGTVLGGWHSLIYCGLTEVLQVGTIMPILQLGNTEAKEGKWLI